jgi:hypothetical protein
MELTGQVWFTFGSTDVWQFYRFARLVAESGTEVGLDWMPFPTGEEDLAMSTYLTLETPISRGKFLHAMLGLVHIEGRSPSDPEVVADAVDAAAVVVSHLGVDQAKLEGVRVIADGIGVVSSPSLYRHGPPMAISLTTAALLDDPSETLRTILSVSDDDGIWELRKP